MYDPTPHIGHIGISGTMELNVFLQFVQETLNISISATTRYAALLHYILKYNLICEKWKYLFPNSHRCHGYGMTSWLFWYFNSNIILNKNIQPGRLESLFSVNAIYWIRFISLCQMTYDCCTEIPSLLRFNHCGQSMKNNKGISSALHTVSNGSNLLIWWCDGQNLRATLPLTNISLLDSWPEGGKMRFSFEMALKGAKKLGK